MKKDIFISYKNDGEGRNFAARLCSDLSNLGYSVYYNPNEQHAGSFPERLREAVKSCNDFLLIVTQPCLNQLMANEPVDWVREEILAALEYKKNIIPLLMPGVSMPKNKKDMPEALNFLPDKDSISMSESYNRSPMDFLLSWLLSKGEEKDAKKDIYNSNLDKNIDIDFKTSLEKANNGDYKSVYEHANLYYYGLVGNSVGCQRNYHEAYNLYKMLSKCDNDYSDVSSSMIAEMYYNGVVPRESQSYKKALDYHKRAKNRSGFSSREYAYLKSRGCGCDFNYEEIEQSYLEAIEQGDNMAILGLAKIYTDYGQFNKAADLYKRTSHILPDAEFRLGLLYRSGVLENPPKPDFFRAAFYFQHAIESGRCSSDVYYELGRLYYLPTGDFPKDFHAAEKYFLLAAEKGNKEAYYKLGLIYEYGQTERNINKAIKYHSLAVENGSSFAAYHLAMLYSEPEVKNYQKAFKYAEIAAQKGVMEGEYLYGMYLYYGRGCDSNEDLAYNYFTKAFEHGMFPAKLMIDKIKGRNYN